MKSSGRSILAEGTASSKTLSMACWEPSAEAGETGDRLFSHHGEGRARSPRASSAPSSPLHLWRTETKADPAQGTQNTSAEIARTLPVPTLGSTGEKQRVVTSIPQTALLSYIRRLEESNHFPACPLTSISTLVVSRWYHFSRNFYDSSLLAP